MFCENCGAKVDDDAVFCENCGERQRPDASGVIVADAGSPELARRFTYAMDDYGPCEGPVSGELLVRALYHVQNSESNFFELTEKATGRFLQTPGHCYLEASPSMWRIYGRNFSSIDEIANVFINFLLLGQFPDISGWERINI